MMSIGASYLSSAGGQEPETTVYAPAAAAHVSPAHACRKLTDHLRVDIEAFIEEYYNRRRLHSALASISTVLEWANDRWSVPWACASDVTVASTALVI
jgi:hypothetical protein